MFTRPSQVIIGKQVNIANIDNLAVGDITVVNEDFKVGDANMANALYIGVCIGEEEIALKDGSMKTVKNIKWSDRIQKASKPSYAAHAYEAPSKAIVEIDGSNAEAVIGHRYVLRLLFKDIEVANFQFTHTYEHVAESDNMNDVLAALMQKINRHANRRVIATLADGKLTLTAMDKNYDNEVDSLDEYSIVSMDASLYVTIPGALLNNQPEPVKNVIISKTEGNPGKGFWKQVRDREVRAMGYKGIVMTGAYPTVEQERMTVKGAEYNYITIENDNLYLSPDNQYIKTTPVLTEVFCEGDVQKLADELFRFGAINKSEQ